jgi:MSHA biogenesis protein MshO
VRTSRVRGFSLIELIIVIVVGGILASMIAGFIARPIQSSIQVARQAVLVDTADTALRRIGRDVRRALPNSIRSADPLRVEFINATAAATYRASPGADGGGTSHPAPADVLSFNTADSQFNILGPMPVIGSNPRIAIYSTDPSVHADAATGASGTITPATTTITLATTGQEQRVTLSQAFVFNWASPQQRLYFVDGPVSYVCDPANNQLLRFSGYAYQTTQPSLAGFAALGITGRVVAQDLNACEFHYDSGTSTRAGLLGLDVTLQNPQGERVRLLRQVHVENSP